MAFDKQGCAAMLRRHPQLEDFIVRTVTTQLEHGLFRSKFATSSRYEGHAVRECRVNAGAFGPVRVAFIVQDATATVIYISRTLQKRAFTAELDRFLARRPS